MAEVLIFHPNRRRYSLALLFLFALAEPTRNAVKNFSPHSWLPMAFCVLAGGIILWLAVAQFIGWFDAPIISMDADALYIKGRKANYTLGWISMREIKIDKYSQRPSIIFVAVPAILGVNYIPPHEADILTVQIWLKEYSNQEQLLEGIKRFMSPDCKYSDDKETGRTIEKAQADSTLLNLFIILALWFAVIVLAMKFSGN